MLPRAVSLALLILGAAGCSHDETTRPPVQPPPDDPCKGAEAVPGGGCVSAGVPADACAEGFEPDGAEGCAPVLPAEPCADGTLAIPGEEACHEVARCPDAKYGDAPVGPDTEHVDGAYAGGGSDGSEAKPWTTVAEAIDAAADGALVAVAAGTYAENLATVGKSVRIWGRCPALVTLEGAAANAPAVQLGEGGAPELHTLAVTGPFVGVFVSGGANIVIDRVRVHDTGYYGVVVADQFGPTSARIEGSLIERATGLGAGASGTELAFERSVVQGTIENDDAGGEGLLAQDGAVLTVTRSVIAASHQHGVHAVGSTATVEGSVIRGILPDGRLQRGGLGVGAFTLASGERAHVVVRASVIAEFAEAGVLGATADVEIESTVIRDALGPPASGTGVLVAEGSSLTIRDSLIAGCRDAALAVRGSSGVIERVAARDTGGFGAVVYRQGTGEIRQSIFERCAAAGVYFEGSTGSVDSVVVRDTGPDPANGLYGDGIVVNADGVAPGAASITATRVETSARVGISSFGSVTTISGVALECNPVQLDVETSAGSVGSFDQQGEIACACDGKEQACEVQSAMLAPPEIDDPEIP